MYEYTIYNFSSYARGKVHIGYNEKGKKFKYFRGDKESIVLEKILDYINSMNKGTANPKQPLQDYVHDFLFDVKRNSISDSSFDRYYSTYRLFIKDTSLGVMPLKDIKPHHIQNHYNHLIDDEDFTPDQVKQIQKVIRPALTHAVNHGAIEFNPSLGIEMPKSENSESIDVFSMSEIDLILNEALKHWNGLAVIIGILTGLRQGEILAFKWSDVDFKERYLTIRRSIKRVRGASGDGLGKSEIKQQKGKNEQSLRYIVVTVNLLKLLEAERDSRHEDFNKDAFIFLTKSGNLVDASTIRKTYTKVLRDAGVRFRKFHNLRHTFASRHYENGTPIQIIQELLGHKSIVTTEKYIHRILKAPSPESRKYMDLFEKSLDSGTEWHKDTPKNDDF